MKIKKNFDSQEEVEITTEFIKLEAFLKFCGAVMTGGEAKNRITNEEVSVNGSVCTMRGKKLHPGDSVSMDGMTWIIKGL